MRYSLSLNVNSVIYLALIICIAVINVASADEQDYGPQDPPFVANRPIAIVNGDLIDATGAAPKLAYTVIIQGEKITDIGPSSQVDIPKGAQVIDAKGMTVMPGLINANQHLQLNPLFKAPVADVPLDRLKERWAENFSRMPRTAFTYLMQGVTSMRHTSGPAAKILPLKKKIDSGEVAGPRVFLGGALFISRQHFNAYYAKKNTNQETIDWFSENFAYKVVDDIEEATDEFLGDEYRYWKLYLSDEQYNGHNDFSDEQIRRFIEKAHQHGKKVDVHAGATNIGLARIAEFDIDSLEHPFYGSFEVATSTINKLVDNDVVIATLLRPLVAVAEHAMDPHKFSESLFITSMTPKDYRLLLRYRDKIVANIKDKTQPGRALFVNQFADTKTKGSENAVSDFSGLSYDMIQQRRQRSIENMRSFINAGAKFSIGTDTPTFLNFPQQDPFAVEFSSLISAGLPPMDAIIAATRNGAQALGIEDKLGTIEKGKIADVIVVAGNPLADADALKRVFAVIKGGVRYK